MKRNYDRKAKPRKLEVGSMVLLRVPVICGKLNDAWDGPYEVHKRVGEVNYEVVIPNVKEKTKMVHVNNCKEWHQSEAMVLRVVFVVEDNGEEPKDKLGLLKEN